MKTLHYVAHIALLTAFVIFTLCAGVYLTGSDARKDAMLSVFKKDLQTHHHTSAGIVTGNTGDCRICLELGISGCTGAIPHHARLSCTTKAEVKSKSKSDEKLTLGGVLAVWTKSLIPERTVKEASDHIEKDVLMTYAAWD